jgi:hypothetical protein
MLSSRYMYPIRFIVQYILHNITIVLALVCRYLISCINFVSLLVIIISVIPFDTLLHNSTNVPALFCRCPISSIST